MKYVLWTFGLACLLITGCSADSQAVRLRAANDLGCSEGDLTVHEIGEHSFQVNGCGAWATYTCSWNDEGVASDWSCAKEAD
jgi:hypothetical protein